MQVAFLTLERKVAQCCFKALILAVSKKNVQHQKNADVQSTVASYMVGLFSCVDTQVALQSLQVPEARSTNLTRIWLLTSMD